MLRELLSLENSFGFRVAKGGGKIQKKRSTITGAWAASLRTKSAIKARSRTHEKVRVLVIAKLVPEAPANTPVEARPFVVGTPVSVRHGYNYFDGVPVVEAKRVVPATAVVLAVPIEPTCS